MSRILANIFQNRSLLTTFYVYIYGLAISPQHAVKQRPFCLKNSKEQLYKQVGKDTRGKKGENINIGFCVNRSVKISGVRGYQLWGGRRVILQSAGFISKPLMALLEELNQSASGGAVIQ